MNSNAPTISTGGFEVLEIPKDMFHLDTDKACQCANCNPTMQAMPGFFEYYENTKTSNERMTYMDKVLLVAIFAFSLGAVVFLSRKYKI